MVEFGCGGGTQLRFCVNVAFVTAEVVESGCGGNTHLRYSVNLTFVTAEVVESGCGDDTQLSSSHPSLLSSRLRRVLHKVQYRTIGFCLQSVWQIRI